MIMTKVSGGARRRCRNLERCYVCTRFLATIKTLHTSLTEVMLSIICRNVISVVRKEVPPTSTSTVLQSTSRSTVVSERGDAAFPDGAFNLRTLFRTRQQHPQTGSPTVNWCHSYKANNGCVLPCASIMMRVATSPMPVSLSIPVKYTLKVNRWRHSRSACEPQWSSPKTSHT